MFNHDRTARNTLPDQPFSSVQDDMDLFSSQVQTVSQLTRQLKKIVEQGFPDISIQGEISNCRTQSSGHVYLTLKDEGAQLPAVIWRGTAQSLGIRPQDGMKVIADGELSLYEPHGKYQMIIRSLRTVGIGELQRAFENLKEKLYREGLFDPVYKKELPEYPETIGIITSPTGAAVQDLISVISRRNPMVALQIYPAKVQGEGSASEVVQGIRYFNRHPVDLLIVGRGGGSFEDLWTFNEEEVARAIFKSKIPVISAVGHEIDFTIADFVADVRAATPSQAGEIAVKESREIEEYITGLAHFCGERVSLGIRQSQIRVRSLLKSHALNKPADLVRMKMMRVDDLSGRLTRAVGSELKAGKRSVEQLTQTLGAFNPKGVLKRGYTLVYRNGKLVTASSGLKKTDSVEIEFSDGTRSAEIT
ncbi:MAG: exodeoxyribonuclease VII large subunit [Bacteroidetes bacterium]|nr:exodeoxyribonuclease VII large subunit [Bacteroidota bacterium]